MIVAHLISPNFLSASGDTTLRIVNQQKLQSLKPNPYIPPPTSIPPTRTYSQIHSQIQIQIQPL